MKVDNNTFAVKLPAYLINRINWYIEKTGVSIIDALRAACREVTYTGTLWYKAWYHDDFREIYPDAYLPEYLDFEKYPLKYKETT